MTFGKKLKELRDAAGLSRAALAANAGVSPGFVRDLEQDHRTNPSWNIVRALVAALGTDCTAFADCTDVLPPAPAPPAKPARKSK